MVKTADPITVPEPGGDVTFSFVVTNDSPADAVTIDTLNDSIYGDITAIAGSTCVVPQTLAVGGDYSCSFTANVSGNAGDVETNVVTASGTDDDGNDVSDTDDAVVTVTDVPSSMTVAKTADPVSVAEPGGDVTFTFVVTNTSAVDVLTLNSLNDSIYGDLNGQGDCSVPQTLAAAGGSYSCSITKLVSGNAGFVHTNVVTATATDNDGNTLNEDDDAMVTVTDVSSGITIVKTANPIEVAEPGGDVTFSFVITNDSLVDAVTIDSLVDSIYGDLNGQGDCSVPQSLTANGGTYSCSFTANVTGNAGDVETNVVMASGTDDDGNDVADDDDAEVTVTDVLPDISITKTADVTSVPETGGDVTFSFVVTNNVGRRL